MGDYRDDRSALRQRVESLEDEIESLREENRRLREEPEPSLDDSSAAEPHPPDAALVPPPRAVSLSLTLATLFNWLSFNVLIFGLWFVAVPVGYGYFQSSPFLVLVGFAVPAWKLWGNLRAVRLLRNGVAAPAKVLEADDTSSWSYSTNVGRALSGWGDCADEYGGPYCRTRLSVGVPGGKTAERTVRGRPYEGGMFLFDPAHPRSHVGMFELPVPVRPDAAGRWPSAVPLLYLIYAMFGFAGCVGLVWALVGVIVGG